MKYIDAEKLKAEIERRRLSNRYVDTEDYENELLEIIASLQQEQNQFGDANNMEHASNLEHWLAFFGMPEEYIENCVTQIAQGYGAIRYLEGVQHGAEAVNELSQQEQPEVDLDEETLAKEFHTIQDKCFNQGIEGWQREKL